MHLAPVTSRCVLAKDVRVPPHELLVEPVDNVINGEGAFVGSNLGVKDHLLQNISELLDQVLAIVRLDCLDGLVCLLHHVLGD